MEELLTLASKLAGAPLSALLIIAIYFIVKWWRQDIAKYETREAARQMREDELYAQNSSLLREAVAGLQRVADSMEK
jgi:choline-glycine betaine transporter